MHPVLDAQGAFVQSDPPFGDEWAPASFAQEWMWLLDRLSPGTPAYHPVEGIRLRGRLQHAAVEEALRNIIARHDALRTTLRVVSGELWQHLAQDVPCSVPIVRLPGNGLGDLEERFAAAAREEARRPFDLERGPLFRFVLFSAGDEEHALVMTFHHAVVDQWSMRVLVKEIDLLYEALARGAPLPELPLPPLRYVDFARRQRETLRGPALERLLSYWRGELGGELPALELPTDMPRPPTRRLEGARRSRPIDPGLARRARKLGKAENASLLTTTLAAFAALLHRYSGERDLLIGTPFSGRTRPELDAVVGCFINTLPLRIRIAPDTTFRALVGQVRDALKRAIEHQELPLQSIVSELRITPSPDRPPIFQALFTRRNVVDGAASRFGDVRASRMAVRSGASQVDLTWSIAGVEADLRAQITYDVALFTSDTADRMLAHYCTLLAGALETPDRPVAMLPILADDERRRMLVEWNATAGVYAGDRCIHEIFEAVVERQADAVAVSLGEDTVTYRELNARANQLAFRLRALGVRGGTAVAVAMERSIDLVTGILGILKAGGVYVPLDPRYPDERLRLMLADSGAPVVVTHGVLRSRIPPDTAEILALDEDRDAIGAEPTANVPSEARPSDPAYIMYTSGSTGTPKGVVVPHRAVARLVTGTTFVPFGPALTIAQVANVSFDAATFELWGALLHGARLAIIPDDVVRSPGSFVARLQAEEIGAMFLTSALFNQLAGIDPNAFCRVRYLVVGGEALDARSVRRVLGVQRPQKLLNGYGPTETTTFACTFDCDELEDDAASVPIGRPIGNTRVYVLDEQRQPVPVGVSGELHVGGPGVALGYHNDPDATAQRFIADPFTDDPPGVLYATGDRVRYRPDGALEFLGRIDRQVKIRGFRIEPAEIEAALRRHPAVEQNVVLVREDRPSEKRLIAYVVARAGASVSAAELRVFLATTLPDYLLPADTVLVDGLPLTPNGKLDRTQLPGPAARPDLAAPAIPARTLLEAQLVELFEDVLGRSPLGIDDDFFACGGDSLRAALAIARIEALASDAAPRWLFESPTPRTIASRIVEALPPATTPLIRVQTGGKQPWFFLNGDCDGGGVYVRGLARAIDPGRSVFMLPPHGTSGTPALETVEEMAAHYAALIEDAHPGGPYLLAGYCNGGVVAYEIARVLHGRGARLGPLILIAATAFNARVPALRVLRTAVRRVGDVLRWSPEIELLWYRRLRMRALRIAQLRGAPPRAYVGLVLKELRNVARKTPRRASIDIPEDVPHSAGYARMGAILAAHVPRLYDGPVHHIWGDHDQARFPDDPTMGWGAVAPNLTLHRVPGSHMTLVTREAESLARVIRSVLTPWD